MLHVEYHVEKFSGDGQLLESWKKPSKSFLVNFIKMLYLGMSQDTGDTATMVSAFDVTLNPIAPSYHTNLFACAGTAGNARQYTRGYLNPYVYGGHLGIVVGTNATAVSPDQTKLLGLIEHGTAVDELEYFGMLIMDEADFNVDTGIDEAYFEIERMFRNASGASVTIEEIGIYSVADANILNHTHNMVFCILRDVDSIEVADGEYLKIKYRIKVAS